MSAAMPDDTLRCPTCKGAGDLVIGAPYECHGNYFENTEDCPTCDGEGWLTEPVEQEASDAA